VIGPAAKKSIDTEILASFASGLVFIINPPAGSFAPALEAFFESLREANVPMLGSVLCV
jgi:hypothetical protein